jgi:hypothetical protein
LLPERLAWRFATSVMDFAPTLLRITNEGLTRISTVDWLQQRDWALRHYDVTVDMVGNPRLSTADAKPHVWWGMVAEDSGSKNPQRTKLTAKPAEFLGHLLFASRGETLVDRTVHCAPPSAVARRASRARRALIPPAGSVAGGVAGKLLQSREGEERWVPAGLSWLVICDPPAWNGSHGDVSSGAPWLVPAGASEGEVIVDGVFHNPASHELAVRPVAHAGGDYGTALCSGNMQASHDLEGLVDAMASPPVVLIGDGLGRQAIEERREARSIARMKRMDYQPWGGLPRSLTARDVVAQASDSAHVSVPWGTYSALALRSAFLAITPRDSEQPRLVLEEGAGWVCEPGDTEPIAAALRGPPGDPERLATSRAAARSWAERRFSESAVCGEPARLLRQAGSP